MREYPNHYPKAIYFAENWEDQEDFAPEIYIDTSEDWGTYHQAASCYTLISGDNSPFRYLQWHDGASRVRGAERHLDRAVALPPVLLPPPDAGVAGVTRSVSSSARRATFPAESRPYGL